jgi:imidazole glycerol-phosphate synthase subunit HisH
MFEGQAPRQDVAQHQGTAVIALIDYGAGNLASVRKALAAIGASVWTPTVAGEIGRAHGIIVPGVGHFNTTRSLSDDWRKAIQTMADDGVPVLGICVGLQWLFEGSEEATEVPGLCSFPGRCFLLGNSPSPESQAPSPKSQVPSPLKVPHVGWNSLVMPRPSRLMAGVKDGTQVYFTHSYAAPVVDDSVAICEYGVPFSAAVERANVSAVQFHPEKSGDAGLRVLSNWYSNAV